MNARRRRFSGQKRPSTSSRTLQQQQDLDLEGGDDQRERRTGTIESGAVVVNNNCAAPAAMVATAAAAGAVLRLELSYHSRLRPAVSSFVRPADCSVCRRIVSADVDNSLRRVVRTAGRSRGRSTPNMCPTDRPPTARLVSVGILVKSARLCRRTKQYLKRIRSGLCRCTSQRVNVRLNRTSLAVP